MKELAGTPQPQTALVAMSAFSGAAVVLSVVLFRDGLSFTAFAGFLMGQCAAAASLLARERRCASRRPSVALAYFPFAILGLPLFLLSMWDLSLGGGFMLGYIMAFGVAMVLIEVGGRSPGP